MTPYFQDAQTTLYCGDCRDIVPHLGLVDLVLTDPPYGLGEKWQGGKKDWPLHHGTMGWDQSIVYEVPHIIQHGKTQIVWGGHLYTLPPSRGWFIWDKMERTDTFTSGQAEMAWTNLDRPIRVWRRSSSADPSPSGKYHPTQKPLGLMRWCLSFVPEADSVLDPFCGSGTTLIAAKQLGRKAIGIELSEDYCRIAVERLKQEVLPFTPKQVVTSQQLQFKEAI